MKLLPFARHGLTRLIKATYHMPPILGPLADGSDEDIGLMATFESLTSERRLAERHGTPALDPRELAYSRRATQLQAYGLSHINAAFAYTSATGQRFNEPDRGAWYAAFHILTAQEEVGFHQWRALQETRADAIRVRYVELLADFIGTFPDLTDEPEHPALNPVTTVGYPKGQALARALRDQGHAALIYPSVRHKGGTCLVAFAPRAVQNVRPGAAWDFVWAGSPTFTVHAVAAPL